MLPPVGKRSKASALVMVSPRSQPEICLISTHPLVMDSWTPLLVRAGLNVRAWRPALPSTSPAHENKLPEAAAYIVDSSGSSYAAEALVAGIRNGTRRAPVLVVLRQLDEASCFPLLIAGVRGLVRYADVPEQLARAAQLVSKGGFWVPRELLVSFIDTVIVQAPVQLLQGKEAKLNRREREVFQALRKNLSNKEIAVLLHISVSTVKFHVSNILRKLGVRRRSDLLLLTFQEPTLP